MNFLSYEAQYDQTTGVVTTYRPTVFEWSIYSSSKSMIVKIINVVMNGGGSGWISISSGTQFKNYRSIGYFHSTDNQDRLPIVSENASGLSDLNKFYIKNPGIAHINATFILIGN